MSDFSLRSMEKLQRDYEALVNRVNKWGNESIDSLWDRSNYSAEELIFKQDDTIYDKLSRYIESLKNLGVSPIIKVGYKDNKDYLRHLNATRDFYKLFDYLGIIQPRKLPEAKHRFTIFFGNDISFEVYRRTYELENYTLFLTNLVVQNSIYELEKIASGIEQLRLRYASEIKLFEQELEWIAKRDFLISRINACKGKIENTTRVLQSRSSRLLSLTDYTPFISLKNAFISAQFADKVNLTDLITSDAISTSLSSNTIIFGTTVSLLSELTVINHEHIIRDIIFSTSDAFKAVLKSFIAGESLASVYSNIKLPPFREVIIEPLDSVLSRNKIQLCDYDAVERDLCSKLSPHKFFTLLFSRNFSVRVLAVQIKGKNDNIEDYGFKDFTADEFIQILKNYFEYLSSEQCIKDERKAAAKKERSLMTPKLRYEVLTRDGNKCVKCGRTAEQSGNPLEIDHINPISNGGKTELSNLQTLCRDCNRGKGSSTAEVNAVHTDDRHTKLRELKQLLDEGILTQDEFNAEKKRILNS